MSSDTPGIQGSFSGESSIIDYALNGGLGQADFDPAFGNVIDAAGAFLGQPFACLQTSNGYDYYHVLIEQ